MFVCFFREEKERRREEKEEEKRKSKEEEKRRLKEEDKRRKEEEELKRRKEEEEARMRMLLEREADVFDSMQVEVDMDELSLADVEYDNNLDHLDDLEEEEEDEEDDEDDEEEEEEEEEEEDEDYAFPIGPLPQNITNDLKSLDEMVRQFCFYFIKVSLFPFNCFRRQFCFHLVLL